MTPDNGQPPSTMAEVRVRFGPRPTQTMPLDWAERMLSAWRDEAPKKFGEGLAAAAIQADE